MSISIKKVDFSDKREGQDLINLLQCYAQDPQGGEEPLAEYAVQNLVEGLKNTPFAVSFIAYKDNQAIGLANCFYGFSTFSAKPLLNVHDLVVAKESRGLGIGTRLLQAVENEAKENGCCKVTLEVLQQNNRAKRVYQSFGFSGYNVGESENNALFWEKKIN